MTDNIELLATLHDLSSRSKQSAEFLETLIEHDNVPTVLKVNFAEALSVLRIQDFLIQKLSESQLSIEDKLDDIATKHNLHKD